MLRALARITRDDSDPPSPTPAEIPGRGPLSAVILVALGAATLRGSLSEQTRMVGEGIEGIAAMVSYRRRAVRGIASVENPTRRGFDLQRLPGARTFDVLYFSGGRVKALE